MGYFTDIKHAACVAVVAVFNDRNIDVNNVPIFKCFITGYAVTNLLIDGGAYRFRVGLMAVWRIVKRRWDGLLHVNNIIMAELV